MSELKKVLSEGGFAVTAELAPPKGWDFSGQLKKAELLRGRVHAVNVTDMQSACLKASSLGLCLRLRQAGLEPILQMTGRDRNRMALAADALSAAAFGIENVLALTGDHPLVGDCREAKPVYDLDSVGILALLSRLEAGEDCGGNPLDGPAPRFCKGAAVTPVYEPMVLQLAKLRRKVEAGAEYIQTQGIFTVDQLKRFLDAAEGAGIHVPVMAGLIPLKSAGMARYMNDRVPGVSVPEEALSRLEAAAAEGKEKGVRGLPAKLGLSMAAELAARIREEGLCAGVHIMVVGAEEKVPELLELAGIQIN